MVAGQSLDSGITFWHRVIDEQSGDMPGVDTELESTIHGCTELMEWLCISTKPIPDLLTKLLSYFPSYDNL